MTVQRIPSSIFYHLLPLAILFFNYLAISLIYRIYEQWTLLVVILIYWLSLWFGLWFLKNKIGIDYRSWLVKVKGNEVWKMGSIIVALFSLPIIFTHGSVLWLEKWYLVIFWAGYIVINSFLEESFWRGFMISYPIRIPVVLKVLYSTFLFTATRFLILGLLSKNMTSIVLLSITFVAGIIWAVTFQKQKSIIWPFWGHALMAVFNLSVYLYMDSIQLTW